MSAADSELAAGIRLHDRGEFLAAHRALERAWLASKGPSRVLLQGLVQLSAVGVHLARGRRRPAELLLERAQAKLAAVIAAAAPAPAEIDAAALLAATTACRRQLELDAAVIPDPRRFLPPLGRPITPGAKPRGE